MRRNVSEALLNIAIIVIIVMKPQRLRVSGVRMRARWPLKVSLSDEECKRSARAYCKLRIERRVASDASDAYNSSTFGGVQSNPLRQGRIASIAIVGLLIE